MPVVPRSLEWATESPVRISAQSTSAAAPDAVFEVLADHLAWPEWFGSVRKVEVIGTGDGVGSRRRVHAAGMVIEEVFIAWDPGHRWAFTATGLRPAFTRSLIEDCRLVAAGGGTEITYTMHLDPSPAMRPVIAAAAPMIRRQLTKAVTNLAARASSR
jgi:polyketide cyclase/dehydrase/lipid transport protein